MSGKNERDTSTRPAPLNPGDEAAKGVPGTGENLCQHCRGEGRMLDGTRCENAAAPAG